ncbi:malonyl-ACP O-methyltransferase BioC [Anaerophilus nitritogenes]|uniref:malonyl-ACP O-methyltransferase BioC n=1 Tax=Anaerophilus nitritogenes TaxID=2498136 RepID=UPI00101C04D1|nr:malonyl-ACP O-methyltransferase BioC [Anaerophilus nitritogenes]
MINKEKLKRRFSRNAKQYEQYAIIQKNMVKRLLSILNKDFNRKQEINESKKEQNNFKILEIGSGTGYLTSHLVSYFPMASITAVDLAQGMIDYASTALNKENIHWICADVEVLQLTDTYDLIISNATFQWFNNFGETLEKLLNILKPNGTLLFSTFGSNTFIELKTAYLSVAKEMGLEKEISPPSQSFLEKTEIRNLIDKKYNIEILVEKEYEYFDSCLNFFNAIKKIGANDSKHGKKILPPEFIQNVLAHYDQFYMTPNGIEVTYEPLYVKILNSSK